MSTNTKITHVDFSWNKKLQSIGYEILDNLKKLKTANFYYTCAGINAKNLKQIRELKMMIHEYCERPRESNSDRGILFLMGKSEELETKIDLMTKAVGKVLDAKVKNLTET